VRRERKLRTVEGELLSVGLEPMEDGYRIASGPCVGTTVVRGPEARIWSVVTGDGRSFEVLVARGEGETEMEVEIEGTHISFALGAPSAAAARRGGATSGRVEVKAPMPGRVVKILVFPGERVSAGQPVLLFEAMKMQNELRSPQEGVVAEVAVAAGQAVEARERLYLLDPAPQ
jgi:biotin carboxyl carrier protein